MTVRAKDLQLILHIGLHKTASTFMQNLLSARRYDLIPHGVFYPNTGTSEAQRVRTREGAQSGHIEFTRPRQKELVADLLHEVPPTASTVLISAEDFSLHRLDVEQILKNFGDFGSIKVVAVLRRQDRWIESFYKQVVDQYGRFETRSFSDFLAEEGSSLLDFRTRLAPWRDLVGPDQFYALSYDDAPDASALLLRVLEIAGVSAQELGQDFLDVPVPRYDSLRAIETIGLRVLNGYRLRNRDQRNSVAQEICAAAPAGDIELLTLDMRSGLQDRFGPINEQIEAEWFTERVPGLRFGAECAIDPLTPPSAQELVDYMDQVIALCDKARATETADGDP